VPPDPAVLGSPGASTVAECLPTGAQRRVLTLPDLDEEDEMHERLYPRTRRAPAHPTAGLRSDPPGVATKRTRLVCFVARVTSPKSGGLSLQRVLPRTYGTPGLGRQDAVMRFEHGRAIKPYRTTRQTMALSPGHVIRSRMTAPADQARVVESRGRTRLLKP